MKTNPNDLAFPVAAPPNERENGLSKREYIAALAMQGRIASESVSFVGTPESCAEHAVAYADALIAELNKEQK